MGLRVTPSTAAESSFSALSLESNELAKIVDDGGLNSNYRGKYLLRLYPYTVAIFDVPLNFVPEKSSTVSVSGSEQIEKIKVVRLPRGSRLTLEVV